MVDWTAHLLPAGLTLAAWFLSTGLVFWLVARPERTYPLSLAASGLVAIAAVGVLAVTLHDDGIAAAYASFAASLAIWGWHELSFLTGAVTGPSRAPCPPGAAGWDRFWRATATLIHHEIALALTAAMLLALSRGAQNPTGAYAFALLFALRLSAKFNIFVGVPAFGDELLPARLDHLRSYFRRAPAGPLFWTTFATSAAAALWLGWRAASLDGGAAVGTSLLAALAALGVLEHLFLVLPLRDAALWHWASKSRDANRQVAPATIID